MQSRWREWVIALALLALGVTGVWSLWGGDLVELVHPSRPNLATPAVTEPAAGTRTAPPPAGPTQGPF